MIRATLPPEQCLADERGRAPAPKAATFSLIYSFPIGAFISIPPASRMGPGVPRKLEGHRRVSLCTTQYSQSSFANYIDNSKTAYLAMFAYTRAGVEANKRRTLKRKVIVLVGGTRVPLRLGCVLGQ
jgi:hypothetical protein